MPKKGLLISIGLAGVVLGALTGFFYSLVHDLPQINRLKQYKPPAVSRVYASNNQVIAKFYIEKRVPVSIADVPEKLIQALLTIEDRRFFTHSGINFKAILRAILKDIQAGRFKEGASTLTQQLAKTLFLTHEKSVVRKIKEALLALQIERRYTKNEILEMYLNQIYLGSGAYGVEAAAQTYFNKPVRDLDLAETAMIAGLPKGPSIYTPLKNPKLGKQRRDLVLRQMLLNGIINAHAYNFATAQPVATPPAKKAKGPADYFAAYVKSTVRKGFDQGIIYTRGVNIQTTLDLALQRVADESVARHIVELKARMKKKGIGDKHVECAVVAIDVKTGGILCMVGGSDYSTSPFNRAVQALRQPGSAFKPFVYAVALQQGFSQNDVLLDAPLSYTLENGKLWHVSNFSRSFYGPMTLRKALSLSKNTPAVRLMEQIGPEKVVAFARKAGIRSKLVPNLSLALGTSEVNLMELTAAYIPFANMGIRVVPFAIQKIMDTDSRLIFQHTVKKQSVLSRPDAAIITDMLKAVILEGTGKRAVRIKKEIAGKTGTTDRSKDALFIGFSPQMALGVWVGKDDATTLGENETGAKAALPIWTDIMSAYLSKRAVAYFDIPDGVETIYMDPAKGTVSKVSRPGFVRALIKKEEF